jgi:hypothetical protein
MANHYQQFSEAIDDITPDERIWINRVLSLQVDDNIVSNLKEERIEVDDEDSTSWWPGFQFQLRDTDASLLIYADESGDLECVAAFAKAFLAKFRPNDCWSLTWADTCSRPRIGEFSGGGLFITAKSARFFTPSEDISRMRKQFEKRTRRQRSSV